MSDTNHNLVRFFREAAPYIHMHRGKTFVIALSGEVLQQPNIGELLSDIALLSTLGAKIILVHGARPQIEKQLKANKHSSQIHNGLRVTDKDTLTYSKAAIGAIRLEIENHLNRALNRPPIVNNSLGVISGNFITAKPVGVIDGIDHLHTGKVRKINDGQLKQLLDHGNIVLLSPMGYSPTGQIYNLSYEDIAGFTANKLKADKVIFIHNQTSLVDLPKQLNLQQLDKVAARSKINLLKEVSYAIHHNVERAHLIDLNTSGGLLLELYTRDGAGVMIDNSQYDEPRKATIEDVGGILDLIRPLEKEGVLAKRSREQLELEINNFSIIERDGKVIGCAALYIIDDGKTAELACLAIHKEYRTGQRGVKLVNHITSQAKQARVEKLICLTTQSIDWFIERGFKLDSVESLPSHKKALYNLNRKSKVLSKIL
ncbi:amino-acid N-acetyltransferase [Leucothrix sargassi]|nr:amino-acid N-acetyltransferase [Leucothrix sargassi]